MNRLLVMSVLMLTIISLSGCVQTPNEGIVNVTIEDSEDAGMTTTTGDAVADADEADAYESGEDETAEAEDEESEAETSKTAKYKIAVTEGELVSLKPKAVDPDADTIKYMFSKPLDSEGKWQTETGDAGEYYVDVTATDGKLSATQTVLVVVNSANKAPVMTELEDITVNMGETVKISPKATDPDGDKISFSFSGWMTKPSYTTQKGDEGKHKVTVTATDGTSSVSKDMYVTVIKENHAPEITSLTAEPVLEKDTVVLDVEAEDEDGDEVSIVFPEPFNDDGEWQTKVGDAGTYRVVVTATDGEKSASKEVIVKVNALNNAPVLEPIKDITVKEGETVTLNVKASDPDGDKVTVIISGWMNTNTKKTGYDDAGEYQVTIKASDGQVETTQTVEITVLDQNRPPVFVDIVQG
ncbi:cadherin repeat domain-containing protein [Candidatus Woesearchaeota archaeon]|nr:cadherin repeat domain-containing protein [Candidatus Woesearchaeota archaeon]